MTSLTPYGLVDGFKDDKGTVDQEINVNVQTQVDICDQLNELTSNLDSYLEPRSLQDKTFALDLHKIFEARKLN